MQICYFVLKKVLLSTNNFTSACLVHLDTLINVSGHGLAFGEMSVPNGLTVAGWNDHWILARWCGAKSWKCVSIVMSMWGWWRGFDTAADNGGISAVDKDGDIFIYRGLQLICPIICARVCCRVRRQETLVWVQPGNISGWQWLLSWLATVCYSN